MTLICCFIVFPVYSYDEQAKEEIFLSTPEQVATLRNEPEFLVGGIVNPLSGNPILRQTDLVVKGAQELILSRTYMSPHMPVQLASEKQCREEWEKFQLYQHVAHNYKGWQFYPHLKLQFSPSEKQVLVTEPSGSTFCFTFTGSGMTDAKFQSDPYGISNCVGEAPSGSHDPRNIRIVYSDSGEYITVYGTDQGIRTYRYNGWNSITTQLYLLEKETFPNGKVLKYHYDGGQPIYVESLDPNEQFVYASIRIEGNPWKGNVHFLSSSGQAAEYEYERRSIHAHITKKTKHWYGDDRFEANFNFLCPPTLSKVSSPNFREENINYCERFLLCSYEGKDQYFEITKRGYGEGSRHYRVHQLSLPVGEKDTFACVYELSYHPPVVGRKGGKTTVQASDGTSIIYHFSKNLLTSMIQYYGEDGELKKEKIFSWDDKNWLKSIELRDGQKKLFYKTTFEYDRFGNPILETFTGDLSGSGEIESTWTQRTFSDDGKNLLLCEKKENGKVTSLSYFKETNLVSSKLIKDGEKIIQRKFWDYDDCHNLIEEVSDDGRNSDPDDLTGVTERRKTSYILRQSAPFLHMTDTVIDSSNGSILRTRHLTYDNCGNVVEEKVYDTEGNLAYTIERSYNERGDLLSETNRLGQQVSYDYDEKGRRITESNFSGRIHKSLSYDSSGRLISMLEDGDDRNCHLTSSKYDFHDRLIEKNDSFGNSMYYKYDPLVNKISQTEFPKISDLDGEVQEVVTFSSYDPFGRKLSNTDANGNTTLYSYNVYGSISEICHPGGGRERFRYAKNGDLISLTDPEGHTIQYENDVLGRVLKKSYFSNQGAFLAEETFTYNGFHLTSEADKEGNLKQYFYDGAGRKVREDFCGKVTEFAYDPLGRLSTIYKHVGDDALVVHYERDLEDRIVTEKKTDLLGHILHKIEYSYDSDGNCHTITRHINGKEAVDVFGYDAFKRQIYFQDALGYQTHTSYNENYLNAIGQNVLQIKVIDPNGNTTIKTHDAFNRNERVEKIGSDRQTILCHEMIHDPEGNLTLHQDHIYEDGKFRSTQAVRYHYTPDHQIERMIRGYGTQEQRETRYIYSKAGMLSKKILPDGTDLSYTYNPLGYRVRVDSSDGKIAHAFTYNRMGDLIEALDEKQNQKITRKIDSFGNVICEGFPHGIQIEKTYDDLNRPLSINIEGLGQVHYAYDPMYLREIKRTSAQGNVLYKHAFAEYDLNGNLTQEQLMDDLGPVNYISDLRGQTTRLACRYFSQDCEYDSTQNLISSVTDRKESRYQYDAAFQLIREEGVGGNISYGSDSLYNRTHKNDLPYKVNTLNELICDGKSSYEYDLRGNRILKKTRSEQVSMTYDPLNQLTEANLGEQKIEFVYDPLGRRLAKTILAKSGDGWDESDREYYFYDGEEEIGSFKTPNVIESFRVLSAHSLPKTISIETEGKTFAPLSDVQGNIRRLVDLQSKALAECYDFTAFGESFQVNTTYENPWQFAAKRLDPDLGLIYFGKRYYDPAIGRWLTTDPAGFEDSYNPYQYVFNNPFLYLDPNGESVEGFLLGVGEIALGGALIVTGGMLEVATCGGYTIAFGFQLEAGAALIGTGIATATYHAQDLAHPNRMEYPHASSQEYSNYGLVTFPVLDEYGDFSNTRIDKKSKKKKNAPPDPDPRAEGSPHSILEKPGPEGQYTTHNGDGSYKQYRGSGKPHGIHSRPNIKESNVNVAPDGRIYINGHTIRKPRPDEIPKRK